MRERPLSLESPGTYVTAMSFTRPFLLDPVFFRTAPPCSGGYHMDRGGMQFHHTVGINCKKGATTKNQGSGVKYIC